MNSKLQLLIAFGILVVTQRYIINLYFEIFFCTLNTSLKWTLLQLECIPCPNVFWNNVKEAMEFILKCTYINHFGFVLFFGASLFYFCSSVLPSSTFVLRCFPLLLLSFGASLFYFCSSVLPSSTFVLRCFPLLSTFECFHCFVTNF